MGFDCFAAAGDTARKWEAACVAQTKSSNTFTEGGKSYFWEQSNEEQEDGGIIGEIMMNTGPDRCRQVGTFRIKGDGSIDHAPKFLKKAAEMTKDQASRIMARR